MSSTKLDVSGVFEPITNAKSQAQKTCIHLPLEAVHIRKNGIEFLTSRPIPAWTEMTVNMESSSEGQRIRANGVVISSTGTQRTGYVVAMIFLNLSPQAEQQLETLAYSRLA